MNRIVGFLRLTRPANIVTAIADILAGVAVSGWLHHTVSEWPPLYWLVLSTVGLYGGGVVFNDVFDAELDRIERPERPIPSGLIARSEAVWLGIALLILGIVSATMASILSGGIAVAISVAAVVYDKWGKHHKLLGPLNMGMCRGLNLLLGVSIIPAQVQFYWPMAIVPLVYIAAITMISRGEVHGGSRKSLYGALFLYGIVAVAIFAVAFYNGHWPWATLFLVGWGTMIVPPLARAIREPVGKKIGRAVKAGVVALILMNAAWAMAFGTPVLALIIVLLLPLSLLLARAFAVT